MTVAQQSTVTPTVADQAKALCAAPAAYFSHSYTEMQSVSRAELYELQREGLRHRFSSLRDRIPILKKLADEQKVCALEEFGDVVPLLFEHTMYKSYPKSLLENGRFGEINKFLSKLCTYDLTQYDVSECKTIDGWLEFMDDVSPLLIMHSSGTSGTMTFLPVSKVEQDKHGEQLRVTTVQEFGDSPASLYDEDFHVIYPFFRSGGSGAIRTANVLAKFIAKDEKRFVTAYPGRMSSDLLYLGARIRAARAAGTQGQLKIGPELIARKAEYEALQAEMPGQMLSFFGDIAEEFKGKRVFFWGAQNLLYNVTKLAREKGLHNVFRPNSVFGTGGDAKDGVQMPSDWREQVCEFAGVSQVKACYGMTEVRALHHRCRSGHYHFAPWVIPYVLDPDTSKMLPRKGRTTGRAAFFDLGAETRWGGIITGDEITVEWDEYCTCGQTSVWAEDNIQRYSLKRGGDDKITCAATEAAHRDAMDFLTSVL